MLRALKKDAFKEAVISNDVSRVKSLLKAGVKIQSRYDWDSVNCEPVLHYAINKCYIEIALLLIEAEIGINQKHSMFTPLCCAMLLTDKKAGLRLIKALIVAEANVNLRVRGCTSLLQHAVSNGRLDVVCMLVAAGADVNDGNGPVPLHHAVMVGNIAIVDLLISAGANVSACWGFTVSTVLDVARDRCPQQFRASVISHLVLAGAVSGKEYNGNSLMSVVNIPGRLTEQSTSYVEDVVPSYDKVIKNGSVSR